MEWTRTKLVSSLIFLSHQTALDVHKVVNDSADDTVPVRAFAMKIGFNGPFWIICQLLRSQIWLNGRRVKVLTLACAHQIITLSAYEDLIMAIASWSQTNWFLVCFNYWGFPVMQKRFILLRLVLLGMEMKSYCVGWKIEIGCWHSHWPYFSINETICVTNGCIIDFNYSITNISVNLKSNPSYINLNYGSLGLSSPLGVYLNAEPPQFLN